MERDVNLLATQKVKDALGEYQFQAIMASAEIEVLKARMSELEKKAGKEGDAAK